MARKLGKLGPREDRRTLRIARYLEAPAKGYEIEPDLYPPMAWDGAAAMRGTPWGMMGNDVRGNCTCAAAGHLIQCWTANAQGAAATVADEAIVRAYQNVTRPPYDPIAGTNDSGAVCLDVLNYWRQVGIGGRRILGYASLANARGYLFTPGGASFFAKACWMFGGLYVGLRLPMSAQRQLDEGKAWTPATFEQGGQLGSWGGHCVGVVGFDQGMGAVAGTGTVKDPDGAPCSGLMTCVTWGQTQVMTWEFFERYCDEAYVALSMDLFPEGVDRTPEGLNLAQLKADLAAITDDPIATSSLSGGPA
jgi:hypothetical protein